MNIQIKPVDSSVQCDFEQLFESKGGPKHCWCMLWRNKEDGKRATNSREKKQAMLEKITNGIPVGLLGYINGEPVAWCSIAPRETYRSLGGDKTHKDVWSIVCFFIQRRFRQQGLTEMLITKATEFAEQNGAHFIEAYPVAPGSPSYRFMGHVPSFEKARFNFVKKAGKRRNVMIKQLVRNR